MNLLEGNFEERLRKSITFAWHVFIEKAGTGFLPINKEASMQLQYSYILQQVIPHLCFSEKETVKIELETGVNINGRNHEIDLILEGSDSNKNYRIAVEMKCYRKRASSGGNRGATDIFMKDVYEDLLLLEEYCVHAGFDKGVALVMTDKELFVNPKKREAKCWDYNISNGTKVSNVHLETSIGGKKVDIHLKKTYEFTWIQKGQFWFLENEGV